MYRPPPPTPVEKTSRKGLRMPVDGVLAVWAAFLAVCAAVAPGGVYGADTAWVEKSISTRLRASTRRRGQKSVRFPLPTVGEATRTAFWGRRQPGKQIERFFGAADRRGSKSNGFLGPPTVGEANRTAFWGRRQSGKQIERLFGAADGRGSKSNGFLGPPTVGEANRTAFWGRRRSAEQIERLFGNTNEKGDEKWQPT